VVYILHGSWIVLKSQKTIVQRGPQVSPWKSIANYLRGIAAVAVELRVCCTSSGTVRRRFFSTPLFYRVSDHRTEGERSAAAVLRTTVVKLVTLRICEFDIVQPVRYHLHSPTTARNKITNHTYCYTFRHRDSDTCSSLYLSVCISWEM